VRGVADAHGLLAQDEIPATLGEGVSADEVQAALAVLVNPPTEKAGVA